MKTWWIGFVAGTALLVTSVALAQQSKVYASMVVTGTIIISPDGSVSGYTLDKATKLPSGVQTLLSRAVPNWKFHPVMRDGKPVKAKSYMSVRLVAEPMEHGKYSIRISGAHFGRGRKGTWISYDRHQNPRPKYPGIALRQGMTGTVYLVMQIGRDGKAHRVEAQQVDLFVKGSPQVMKWGRRELSESSVDWAEHLTFTLPTKGSHVNDNHWVVRIPVTYRLRGPRYRPRPSYGQWQAYIPGPTHYIPWLGIHVAAQGSIDAIPADGGLYPMQQSLHLLTPLGNGS